MLVVMVVVIVICLCCSGRCGWLSRVRVFLGVCLMGVWCCWWCILVSVVS